MPGKLVYRREIRRFKLKTLSPLHIGDSEPWQKDFDYLYHAKSKTVFFIDYQDFLNQFDTEFLRKTDELKEFQDTLLTYFRERKLKILRKYSLPHETGYIYPFVRAGGAPLVPGSSLKGALRTAVLVEVLKKKLKKGLAVSANPEVVLQKQVGREKDNIKQSMDSIQVRDLPINAEALSLFRFCTYSLQKLEFKEKADKTRVVEAIPANTPLAGELILRMVYREQDRYLFEGIEEIIAFAGTLANHYRDWIRREIVLLEQFPSPEIQPVITFYETLLSKLASGSLLLQVGFGTGWEGKTGTFLMDNRFLWEKSILEYLPVTWRENDRYRHLFMRIMRDNRYLKCPQGHTEMKVSKKDAM